MNFKNQPFGMGMNADDAIKKNIPGARKMSRAHNLLHEAEGTNALGVGGDMARTAYVCGLLDEAEKLCAEAREELLRSPAGKDLVRLDTHDPKDAKILEQISVLKKKAARSKTKKTKPTISKTMRFRKTPAAKR